MELSIIRFFPHSFHILCYLLPLGRYSYAVQAALNLEFACLSFSSGIIGTYWPLLDIPLPGTLEEHEEKPWFEYCPSPHKHKGK